MTGPFLPRADRPHRQVLSARPDRTRPPTPRPVSRARRVQLPSAS